MLIAEEVIPINLLFNMATEKIVMMFSYWDMKEVTCNASPITYVSCQYETIISSNGSLYMSFIISSLAYSYKSFICFSAMSGSRPKTKHGAVNEQNAGISFKALIAAFPSASFSKHSIILCGLISTSIVSNFVPANQAGTTKTSISFCLARVAAT